MLPHPSSHTKISVLPPEYIRADILSNNKKNVNINIYSSKKSYKKNGIESKNLGV